MPGVKKLTPTRPGTERKKGKGERGNRASCHVLLPSANLSPFSFPLFPLETAAGPVTETSPDIDVEEKLKDAFARGWSVIVWNDPINLMDYVVYVFKTVLKMNDQLASRHMWEVHQLGKSVVARETREKSEMLVHRLRGFGLNATLEQA
jgi:ATP-dependent Clp protease adaptor protein ClpS